MVDHLTSLDQIAIASICGSFLGTLFALITNTVFRKQQQNINCERIKNTLLGSMAMGLFAGCFVFGLGSFDVSSVESTTPLLMFVFIFSVSFFPGVADNLLQIIRLIINQSI